MLGVSRPMVESLKHILTKQTGGATMAGEMTIEILDDFANGWNEHDLDKLMSFMTQDCVFELSAGPEAWGARFEGYDNVREGYKRVLDMFPDGQWAEPSHFIAGDRGVTQWTFRATGTDRWRSTAATCSTSTATRSGSRTRSARSGRRGSL